MRIKNKNDKMKIDFCTDAKLAFTLDIYVYQEFDVEV